MTDLLEKFEAVHGPKVTNLAEFDDMFEKAMMTLNDKYLPGTYDYISANHTDLYQQILKLENKLHALWGVDINVFREVLVSYYRITLDCIQIFKNSLDFSQESAISSWDRFPWLSSLYCQAQYMLCVLGWC